MILENKPYKNSNDKQSGKSTAEIDSTSQTNSDEDSFNIIDSKTNENNNKIRMMA